MANSYINLPISFCEFLFQEKLTRPMQLFLLLKRDFVGICNIDSNLLNEYANELGVTLKTVKNYLNQLLSLQWVGRNPTTGTYFIRGIDYIRGKYQLLQRISARFFFKNIKNIQAFCFAVAIKRKIQINKYWERRVDKQERLKGRSCQSLSTLPTNIFSFASKSNMVATTTIAKVLNCSISTVSLLKRKAVKARLLKVRKNWHDLKVSLHELNSYKENFPEYAKMVRIKNDKVQLQLTDSFHVFIEFSKRKKIETN